MNRRRFIKQTSWIGGFAWLFSPSLFAYTLGSYNYSQAELMGKGNIPLQGKDFRLRKEAANSFIEMQKAARQAGLNLYSASSFRSYDHQNAIWTRKYKAYKAQGLTDRQAIVKIITYSTIPGTSRHHWGTDLDLIDLNKTTPKSPLNAKHFEKGGVYYKLKIWLNDHAESFGFYEVYTNDPTRMGFKYEPWHFSYKPLSTDMLRHYLQLDIKTMLQGAKLLGSDSFTNDFVKQYTTENILSINKRLI